MSRVWRGYADEVYGREGMCLAGMAGDIVSNEGYVCVCVCVCCFILSNGCAGFRVECFVALTLHNLTCMSMYTQGNQHVLFPNVLIRFLFSTM